jgi:hypothetical protein
MATPVIFVPGIMGTRLDLPISLIPPFSGPDWDTDDSSEMSKFFLLNEPERVKHISVISQPIANLFTSFPGGILPTEVSFNPYFLSIATSTQTTIDNFMRDRGWTSVAWSFYGLLLTTLETTLNIATPFFQSVPFPVYAFGYDWRYSNKLSAIKLQTFISDVLTRTGSTQVILITHSMGGLVARTACLDPVTRSSVKGIIHVAQPANGAVVAYRRCLTGFQAALDGSDGYIQTKFFQNLFGSTPQSYIRVMAGLPGAFELLPNNRYNLGQPNPWLVTDSPLDLSDVYSIYALDAQPGIIPSSLIISLGLLEGTLLRGQIEANILSAKAFHGSLGDSVHPNTHVLFSTGLATDTKVTITAGSIVVDRPSTGDGTVPDVSASMSNFINPGLNRAPAFGGEHATIFKDVSIVPNLPSTLTLTVSAIVRSI